MDAHSHPGPHRDAVREIRDYILDNLGAGDGRLALARLCRRFGVSKPVLLRRFQRHYGQAPAEFIREQRMLTAKSYLSGTMLEVAEIAELVGYGSLQAFYKAFRRHTGVAPLVYRRDANGAGKIADASHI
jgi:AraC-like DNA-binding protein